MGRLKTKTDNNAKVSIKLFMKINNKTKYPKGVFDRRNCILKCAARYKYQV